MYSFQKIFKPDYERYEGVRPINICHLRLLYFMMAVLSAWIRGRRSSTITVRRWQSAFGRRNRHCPFWAVSSAKMAADYDFYDFYKALWLIVVAFPLWRTGVLAGSPAEEITGVFLMIPLPIIAVP